MNYSIKSDFYPLLRLSIPLVFSGMAQSFIYFFETIFFAKLGTEALAAGALASWLAGTLIVVVFGILSAVNVLISHKHGSNEPRAIAFILRDGMLLAILLAIPAFLLFWNIAPVFLSLGQDPLVVSLAKPYLHALAWLMLPDMIMFMFLELLMGLGRTRSILIFNLISVIITIISSYLLIFGKLGLPALGISGAGWGMLVSSIITLIIQVLYLFFHKSYRSFFSALFKFKKPSFLGELLQLGLPMGLMYSVEVGFFFALTLFMGNLGAKSIAANQIALQYLGIIMSIIFSIAQAITIRMGHLLGAEKPVAAKKAAYMGFAISLLFTGIVALCYWTFPKLFIAIDFNVNDPKNAAIVHYTKLLLAISALFQMLEAIRLSLFGALRGLRDTHFTLIISIISFWGLSLPLGYLFAIYFNIGGAGYWWGMVIGATCSVLLLYWRFKMKIEQYLRW